MQLFSAVSKIDAALSSTEMKAVGAMLHAAAMPKIREPLKLAALDEHLKGSRLTVVERIALKSAMSRAGLLV